MPAQYISWVTFPVFFIIIMMFIYLGRRIAASKSTKASMGVLEGAIFTLMAFLVALTFTTASQRFDHRRQLIIDEVNSISTVYLRLDLLEPHDQALLKKNVYDYLSTRIEIYEAIPDMAAVNKALQSNQLIQRELWKNTVNVIDKSPNSASAMLIIPAVNTMLDIGNTRNIYSHSLHLHSVILFLLILVTIISALISGYATAGKSARDSLLTITYALIISITIYIIIDLEFPRLGMIRENDFDLQFKQLKSDMQNDSAINKR